MPELKEIELTKVKLTPKQRMFLKELIATLSPTEAAMRSYNCKDRLSARVIASENLSKLNITMNDLMDKMGLTVEEDIEDLKQSPEIALITNLFPDHLNRYKSFKEYRESKKPIFEYQREKDILLLNYDNPYTRELDKEDR